MTQSELAEKLNVSVQAVSKWECGVAIPDLWKLSMLADLFAISMDDLIGRKAERKNKQVMIAVAGDGRRTEFLLFDEIGTILNRKVLGACNPNYYGTQKCCEILQAGIDMLINIVMKIDGIFIGIPGYNSKENNAKVISNFLARTYPKTDIMIRSNIHNITACFPDLKQATFVIWDTGSLVYAKSPEHSQIFGGWGYLLEKEGSLLSIGKDAISAVLAEANGVGEKTSLTERVIKHMGTHPLEDMETIYRQDLSSFIHYAPYVFEAYRERDRVAEKILSRNFRYIAQLLHCAQENVDCGDTIVLSSALQDYEDIVVSLLQENGLRNCRFLMPSLPQIYGACLQCSRFCGNENIAFEMNLRKNYQNIARKKKEK